MDDVKTVDNILTITDPLIAKQREDVAKMRASLLCCSSDPYTAQQAMRNITILRVYHQVARIIKYLDTIDKIENKLYDCIDAQLDKMDVDNPLSWMTLMKMQEKLQKNLIDSQKLLEPYLNTQEFIIDQPQQAVEGPEGASILSKSSRDKLRSSAQQVLAILGPIEAEEVDD